MSRPPPNGYRDASNASNASSFLPPTGTTMPPQGRAMSRAERFEDEKKRIIDSCFSKLDPSGQLAESYITHIRVQEDAQHPTTPAPPDASPDAKKPRLIIIAVRSTGRVRMHKARENTNGSFSIGKTWNLEELSAIESYANNTVPPQNEREAQYRSWAGNVGFTVTITKPYYWQAGTAKEKEFFIASTVKIYRKYTKGQVPELRGFDDMQMAQMTGGQPGQPLPAQGPPQMGTQPPPEPMEPIAPPQPPFAQRPQSREHSQYRGSPGPPPSMTDSRTSSGVNSRHESPAPYGPKGLTSPSSIVPKPFASTEHLRSNSREAYRDPQRELRPGTAPGPGGFSRSPPPNIGQMSQSPPPTRIRNESPAVSVASSRGETPRGYQQGPQSPSPYSQQMNGSTGASLFQATQQKWMEQNQNHRSQSPPQTHQQLPPIETSSNYRGHKPQISRDQAPKTAGSEISSPGMDAGEAAAFAAVDGFMGPDHSFATAPAVNEPPSPPTPERSRKRPPMPIEDTHSDSELRPAPLAQRSAASTTTKRSAERSLDPSSNVYTAPQNPPTPAPAPQAEELPQVKPLSPVKSIFSDVSAAAATAVAAAAAATTTATTLGTTPSEQSREGDATADGLEEQYRPGLGPMIKKKAVADRFKKAATAASAFKPRPGGAAEKILRAKAEREAGGVVPDGITGVVPRPAPAAPPPAEEQPALQDDFAVKDPVPPVLATREVPGLPPKVEISSPVSPAREQDNTTGRGVELTDGGPSQRISYADTQDRAAEVEPDVEQPQTRPPAVKVKRRSSHQEMYLTELGIDRSVIADQGLEFESMLNDFGWSDTALSPKALADIEADLKREQARLEAGAWLSNASQEEAVRIERERQVAALLDKAIQECDEMDGLLTIYGVELSTLNEDISYIEAQSQGLQVQAANQRTLQTELSSLVATLSLDRRVFDPLRHADLGDLTGLEEAESGLVKLYEALVKIDPSVRSNSTSTARPKSRGDMNEGSELAGMRAVRQKRDAYGQESDRFCQRVMQHLESRFSTAFSGAKSKVLLPVPQGTAGMMKLNPDAFNDARRGLWVYSPLVLFAKEVNKPAWQTLLRMYHTRAKPLYADAFGQNVAYWKRCVRKPTGEEAELLFTTQEKEDAAAGSSGALSSARKLTVKRSQTLAKTLRSASGDKHGTSTDSRNTGSMTHAEIFSGAITEMAVQISYEQNFVVDFFHASSLETTDFLDLVARTPPDQRYGSNLMQQKPLDPDRDMARQVTGAIGEIFSFFQNEMTSLVDWCITIDPIQGVGVMASLTRHAFFLQDTSQEFLLSIVESLKGRLMNLFAKFVDEQVRAIEDTKVKIKKRRGVIGFMKTFPHFAMAVENTFASVAKDDYESNAISLNDTRVRLDAAYDRLNGAMFDSLKVIAKESPSGSQVPVKAERSGGGGADDPEDKEMLNYHVLIIENMNHYLSEVDDGGRQSVLNEWRERAERERREALDGYVAQVVRRPLGKLLEFLDSINAHRTTHPNNPASITARPSFSRKAARSLLSAYDAKEVRRGIDQLRARIEKHFGHGEDEVKSRELVTLVSKECLASYEKVVSGLEGVVKELYPSVEGEKGVEVGFSRADVASGFGR